MTYPFGEVVIALTRAASGRDADGNNIYTSTSTVLPAAAFIPGGSTESVQGQDLVTQNPSFVWVDTIPDLTAFDALQRADGSVWEITGNPLPFANPFTGRQVLQVNVKRVTG